ncbi:MULTISPECIES: GGDEF domain-containing protein [Streptomycetaceae]|uniref:Secreted protein n=1 Tax=Streptantibioticus cattleyicolor (strain ATCC 35852 / DSM 46488 / JCM 4925 / NBRC 14057 / NRRL 8057) TaxID=1003195 RepID=F8K1A9_STREN|nr:MULTISPECIES: diguanylate cyclase [Streptomycetaceae]AEW96184.1 secreted protein [Streptantibioticus cattleyicolor NRRL 8057 = DSM 46488]MYS60707.1 diguanylate cyclase [Streptomyces sp. SID5468]CCB76520.1 putative secreted protein [Streptantibioticus cattleyicolor NRRL 8057 = DSM 46488]
MGDREIGGDARLMAVVALARAVAAAQTPVDAARAAAGHVREALGASFAAVSVWERERGLLRVLVNDGRLAPGEERFPADETYPVHDFPEVVEYLHGEWAGGGEPHAWVETADGRGTGPYPHQRVAALRRRGRGCCVVAPIVLHGRAWGELYIARELDEPVFGRADAEFATVLSAVIAAGVAQTERLEEVRRLAFTDPLTGLANRRAVDARLDEALERHRTEGTEVFLVVCDLNGLKRVNDTLGHEVGDKLLVGFGSVLSLCGAMLPGSLAARLGGDEFCLLAEGCAASEVERAAEELCVRARWLGLGDGVAVGVASTDADAGPVRSARRLFRLADAAQYQAKAERSAKPVIAGRAVAELADAPPGPPPEPGERRTFRGRR